MSKRHQRKQKIKSLLKAKVGKEIVSPLPNREAMDFESFRTLINSRVDYWSHYQETEDDTTYDVIRIYDSADDDTPDERVTLSNDSMQEEIVAVVEFLFSGGILVYVRSPRFPEPVD